MAALRARRRADAGHGPWRGARRVGHVVRGACVAGIEGVARVGCRATCVRAVAAHVGIRTVRSGVRVRAVAAHVGLRTVRDGVRIRVRADAAVACLRAVRVLGPVAGVGQRVFRLPAGVARAGARVTRRRARAFRLAVGAACVCVSCFGCRAARLCACALCLAVGAAGVCVSGFGCRAVRLRVPALRFGRRAVRFRVPAA
ncbi:hypothetical protein [Streptomyces sp. SAI-208]|uniref:hypothetical protein n=1 Tax=Streptomyces sp. SAI-208 TaxID=2940550 RepID=UPI002474629A|nr:hypothetical protein [Streptomyces sp. SAI-208]